jgi:hypothetical protein
VIALIVQLLIAFPKIGKLIVKIRREYVKEIANRRYNKHSFDIEQWVLDPERKQDTRVYEGTEQPRL